MKCLLCENLSFSLICKNCQKTFLTPSFFKRVVGNNLEVYSFYRYSEIDDLLKTKHRYIGDKIFKILAKNSFLPFAKNFEFDSKVFVLPVDDKLKNGYSHTAILAKYLKSKYLKPIYGALRSKNDISYSGKSLEYRLKNPKEFIYNFKSDIDVILVDDIVTTGTTLNLAKYTLQKYGVRVLFALTLADARL